MTEYVLEIYAPNGKDILAQHSSSQPFMVPSAGTYISQNTFNKDPKFLDKLIVDYVIYQYSDVLGNDNGMNVIRVHTKPITK